MITAPALFLGPGEIVKAGESTGLYEVRLPSGESKWAQLAFIGPYLPDVGDQVLIVSLEDGDAYVIGILKGTGQVTWKVPGDLVLKAPKGSIRLEASDGVEISGAERVEVRTRKATVKVRRLNILASSVVQQIGNAYTWATGLVQFKSQRMRAVVSDGWLVRAGRGHVKTTGNMNINGKTIHLG